MPLPTLHPTLPYQRRPGLAVVFLSACPGGISTIQLDRHLCAPAVHQMLSWGRKGNQEQTGPGSRELIVQRETCLSSSLPKEYIIIILEMSAERKEQGSLGG